MPERRVVVDPATIDGGLLAARPALRCDACLGDVAVAVRGVTGRAGSRSRTRRWVWLGIHLSYVPSYNRGMAETITIRTDEDVARALKILTADGTSVSAAVRAAVIQVAHDRRVASLRAEARDLAEDEADRAEMAAVLRDMDSLRAW